MPFKDGSWPELGGDSSLGLEVIEVVKLRLRSVKKL